MNLPKYLSKSQLGKILPHLEYWEVEMPFYIHSARLGSVEATTA